MGRKVGVTFRDPKNAEPYVKALRLVGLDPVLISPDDPKPLTGLDGLVVTGGGDVDPRRYGQEPHTQTDRIDIARDEMEDRLLREALDADLPVLAICRGMQMFNVVHGGSLIQHLDNTSQHRAKGVADVHTVNLPADTRLAAIAGGDSFSVNSRHHQAVERVGPGLVVSARAPDGVIEALERPDKRFAIAVQWHPEDRIRNDPHDRRLFEAFAQALKR